MSITASSIKASCTSPASPSASDGFETSSSRRRRSDVSGWLGSQIDTGVPGTAVSPGQTLTSLYHSLKSLYEEDPANWPEELRERLFGHDHEDGPVGGAASQGWDQYAWVLDLYRTLYGTPPATEGSPVGVRPIEEIGSGGGEAGVDPYQPAGHGATSPSITQRAPTNEGSGSGDGEYVGGLPREEYIRQSGYYSLLSQRQRVRAIAHDTNVADVIRKNHWFLLTDLNAQISAIEDKLGKATGIGREPYKDYSFETKLGNALRRAIDSGEMDDAIAQKLEEIANPVSLGILAASLGAYAVLHNTPAAPFLIVADVGFAASGGTEAALAMQRIWLAVNSATTEQEMDAAAETIVAELSGPAADAILSALVWGAGRGIGKVGDRLEVDPTTFGMGGGNIRKKLDEVADGAAKVTLSKKERLELFNKRLLEAPPATTADEALDLISTTMNKIEDEFSGVASVADPGLTYAGRMYPPREDNITRLQDGGIVAVTAGNIIQIRPDGTIRIYGRLANGGFGDLFIEKPGG